MKIFKGVKGLKGNRQIKTIYLERTMREQDGVNENLKKDHV